METTKIEFLPFDILETDDGLRVCGNLRSGFYPSEGVEKPCQIAIRRESSRVVLGMVGTWHKVAQNYAKSEIHFYPRNVNEIGLTFDLFKRTNLWKAVVVETSHLHHLIFRGMSRNRAEVIHPGTESTWRRIWEEIHGIPYNEEEYCEACQ